MNKDSRIYYRERYSEVIHAGDDPVEVVNSLVKQLMQNDPEAMDVVCRVIYYKFYDLAVRYAQQSKWTSDYVDVILNEACENFYRMCTRGLDESVLTQGVFGLLYKAVYYAYRHIINENIKYSQKTQFENDDADDIEKINAKKNLEDNITSDVLGDVLTREEDACDKKVIDFFRQALMENKEIPYQMITYCYASLLPMMFKESSDDLFKENINDLSSRGKGHSWFKDGKIGGDINKNSSILLKWAVDAMNEKTTGFLSEEFENLYQKEPIVGMPFSWGVSYQLALKEEQNGRLNKDIVITDEFDILRIKNWPSRVEMRLYEDTKKRMYQDKEFRKSAVGRAEKIIYDLSR
ncbi:hypothetical protein KQI69_00515 [Eubacterium sp. MSJ-13]|uniref:hypothetical protein n=1 Tax=Eubacterium sp. MSJ-13 TaxID=2841513 RepID=UPI001C11AD53|nr:hypothetical protein [Eubacterium sp. MSJ-13]MBU5477683.1 hypothetical protein [Eubacterium sp. MSJ-13]